VATELAPGVLQALLAKVGEAATVRTGTLLSGMALAIETQAKLNASTGAHAYGTPTPASPGAGPSVISGTLRRSITHTPVTGGAGTLVTMVGLAPGQYPSYPRKRGGSHTSKTPSSKYGGYLERGELRGGAKYPFPAARIRIRPHHRHADPAAAGVRARLVAGLAREGVEPGA
jgi:hypothetical protein